MPTLLSSHHQGEPLHCLTHYTFTHFVLQRRLVIFSWKDPAPYVQNHFHSLPRFDGHLTARAADVMAKMAFHWFGDVMNVSAAGFDLDLQVQWFKVRVLMLRVVMNSPVFILFLWLLVENRWLHTAKEHCGGSL